MIQNKEKKINEIRVASGEKAQIIKELCRIIDEFKEGYKEEFLLRDLIDNDYQALLTKQIQEIKNANDELSYEKLNEDKELRDLSKKKRDRERILHLISEIANGHEKFTFNHVLTLFKIIIDIKDFILGKSKGKISVKHDIGEHYLNSTVRMVFSGDPSINWNERRFYQNKFMRKDILIIADDVIKGRITKNDFTNLLNPQLQEVFTHYRTRKQVKNGGSLFHRPIVEPRFIKWLSRQDLNKILRNPKKKFSLEDLLITCSKVNRNLEILKFIAFALINTSMNALKISEITGKSVEFIEKCEFLIYKKRVLCH